MVEAMALSAADKARGQGTNIVIKFIDTNVGFLTKRLNNNNLRGTCLRKIGEYGPNARTKIHSTGTVYRHQ